MHFEHTTIPGLYVVETAPRADARGFFTRLWCDDSFARHGIGMSVAQGNCSGTLHAGTVRGLHYQAPPAAEEKLVYCLSGAMFDVAVDLRPDSPTYRQWFGCELTAANGRGVRVPKGVAHGCQALVDDSLLLYYVSAPYTPDAERGVRYDDPLLGIQWPLEPVGVSEKDRSWPLLDSDDGAGA
ncbi:MAG: dTDP-4-dehydrorhamnose 3,5-epimerase [Proteobacteria bacterium]|nr:MAG: dTDP-4-dehydrorhamnose 3,5-epimerase [Pseudomonadota bacterium]